jgi:hypothetical protein
VSQRQCISAAVRAEHPATSRMERVGEISGHDLRSDIIAGKQAITQRHATEPGAETRGRPGQARALGR